MKRITIYLFAASCLLLSCVTSAAEEVQEWVVVLDDPRPARLQGWQASNYSGGSNYNSSLEFRRFAERVAKQYNFKLKKEWFIESLAVYCLIVEFNDDQEDTLSALKKNKRVQWVQPSNDFGVLNSPVGDVKPASSEVASVSGIPSWINGKGVKITIIDSAVDREHQDLAPAVKKVKDFVISDDKSDLSGEAHGTAIAGVLVAQPSKVGLAGVAPGARLTAFRGCWEEGDDTRCNTLSLARALDAVVSNQSAILNLSLSGPRDRLLDRLVEKVVANGTLIVAAFDPQRANTNRFPTRRDGVLIVRAETMDSEHKNEFTAPGARLVASPGNRYDFISGHSIATAYTSGVLALIAQVQQGSAKQQLQKIASQFDSGKIQTMSELVNRLQLMVN